MISKSKARSILGKYSPESNSELEELLRQFYDLADVIASTIAKNNGSNTRLGVSQWIVRHFSKIFVF